MANNKTTTKGETMNETKTADVAYNKALADACKAIEQIQSNMTAHVLDQVEHGHWGHVGDMRHVATQLQQIADQLETAKR